MICVPCILLIPNSTRSLASLQGLFRRSRTLARGDRLLIAAPGDGFGFEIHTLGQLNSRPNCVRRCQERQERITETTSSLTVRALRSGGNFRPFLLLLE